MTDKTVYKSSGLSFTSILTLIFVLCKLTHYIDWSWWWVLSPILISTGLGIIAVVAILAVAVLAAVLR